MSFGVTATVDVTALSVAELAELGVVLRPCGPIVVTANHRRWMSHSAYAALDRRGDEVDRSYARQAINEHVALTGAIKGAAVLRSFPCLGWYRHVDAHGDLAQCDVCGDELVVPAKGSAGAGEVEGLPLGGDDIPV